VSEVGNGWAVAITTLMNERQSIGGNFTGDAIPELLRLARQVEIDGKPAIEDSSVRQKLAEFYVRSRGVKYTSFRTLTALSQGRPPGPEASLGKLVGGVLLQDMGAFGMELEGAAGALLDAGVVPDDRAWQERFLLAPGMRIAGGTDEVLRNIIAERVLRLPPEIRVDKQIAFREVPSGPVGS
jgi:alkylation response protein AidB-like acyl-CoA dehydrogenase